MNWATLGTVQGTLGRLYRVTCEPETQRFIISSVDGRTRATFEPITGVLRTSVEAELPAEAVDLALRWPGVFGQGFRLD